MHTKIKETVKNIDESNLESLQRIWLPQFKIGRQNRNEMKLNQQIKGFEISKDGHEVLHYMEQSLMMIYAAPISTGTLLFEYQPYYDEVTCSLGNKEQEVLIDDSEFFVALMHDQITKSGIDMPLMVGRVTFENWKRNDGLNQSTIAGGTIGDSSIRIINNSVSKENTYR